MKRIAIIDKVTFVYLANDCDLTLSPPPPLSLYYILSLLLLFRCCDKHTNMSTHTPHLGVGTAYNLNWIHLCIRSFLMANWKRHLSFRARTEISLYFRTHLCRHKICGYNTAASWSNNESVSFTFLVFQYLMRLTCHLNNLNARGNIYQVFSSHFTIMSI